VDFDGFSLMDMFPILVAFLSLGLGGILKGTTGAGAPLVAVPALALLFDVPTAIAIFFAKPFVQCVARLVF
jgi:uncharacterized membrane protein YfcA